MMSSLHSMGLNPYSNHNHPTNDYLIFLGRYTAFDEISGNVTSRITIQEDNYTGRGHIANIHSHFES